MPTQPRLARGTPQGPITRAPDPIPVVVVLRWAMFPATTQPGHALAWTRGRSPAVLVQWVWDHPEGGVREDWFPASFVLREQPSPEDLAALLARPAWMPG
jgi:hypothetical protein